MPTLVVLVLVFGIGIGIVLASRGRLGECLAEGAGMGFDHEKLDVYRVAVKFSAWVGDRLEGSLSEQPNQRNETSRRSERVHLE